MSGNVGNDLLPRPCPRYAVLFRTHVWDDFVERQFRRITEQAGSGDVFIVAHESVEGLPKDGKLPLVTFSEADIDALGYPLVGTGGVFWYNIDYPIYVFAAAHPDYSYYVICEYDAVVTVPLDGLIAKAQEHGVGAIGMSTPQRRDAWWFWPSCVGIYRDADVQRMLFPFGVLSRPAVTHLAERRVALARDLRAGRIAVWPHCELFITTELLLAGFVVDELDRYGSTARFNYTPAHLEDDLASFPGNSFIHPLLDTQRYIQSLFKHDHRPERFFVPGSALRKRLSKLDRRDYGPLLWQALDRRARGIATRVQRAAVARFSRNGIPFALDEAAQQLPAQRGSVPADIGRGGEPA